MRHHSDRDGSAVRRPFAVIKNDEESAPTSSKTQRPVVLLATSQLSVRALGTTVLRQAGFQVRSDTCGESILRGLAETRPDLILTDEQLADMHASQLCSKLRHSSAGKTLPLLVISDLSQTAALQGILASDFTDFISPPLNWKAVTFRVHRWISMDRRYRQRGDEGFDLQEVRDSAVKASTELLQLRNYDPVTGLPNRKMFVNAVGLMLSRSARGSGYCAVLHLDIDDFKGVNDVLGRALGDELLRIVAKRLQGSLRDGDLVSQAGDQGSMTSFARLNGDQFAILLGTVRDREGVVAVADRLHQSLSRPFQLQDRRFSLAGRIGIADSHNDDVEEETLVQRAEIAMRYCKQQKGKTTAFFDDSMNELVQRRMELKVELRRALDENELFLCYQPLVDSHTSVPTGVEGLVRWQHPTRGQIPPNEFLPIAEESDLIVEIDRWVLREGCRQGKEWLDGGYPPLLISLNVSIRFLENEDFAQQVLTIVRQAGLPPSALQLELSERGSLPEPGRIMAQFDQLVSAGIHLALDDFGTGQTSLSYLRTLPISCVKLDQSFVRRIPEDSASEAIVTAIVAMSHHLGIKTVAEGVETVDQWRFLANNDYHQLQGYLFSKPEPVAILESRCLRHEGPHYVHMADTTAIDRSGKVLLTARGETSSRCIPADQDSRKMIADAHPLSRTSASDRDPLANSDSSSTRSSSASVDERVESRDGIAARDVETRLLQLAQEDHLTKLHNRFSFDQRLDHALAHAHRFAHSLAVLLLDLDDFKLVNDTHGHGVGDRLLVNLGKRLKKLVRKVDTLARLGGDEFAIVISEFQELRDVAEFAGRLLAEIARPITVEGHELQVTGSLGVAVFGSGDAGAKELLREADLALYNAKSQGGNEVRFFEAEMDREVQRRFALARDLRGAKERGELFLEYQQQVELETGSIVGVEALLRWKHPSKGLIGPRRFIPVTESTGEIRSIGSWVISSACALAKELRSFQGRDVPVSVNVSPVQCRDPGFEKMVIDSLREHNLPPHVLHLELSERLLQQLPKESEGSLGRLCDFGVCLTLDNFGIGTSALDHFQRFRFTRVKIHQSLVQEVGKRSVFDSVVSGMVALTRKLNLEIIAEGVEKPEQRERLLAEGCTLGQGFLFGRPVSAETLCDSMKVKREDSHSDVEPTDSLGIWPASTTDVPVLRPETCKVVEASQRAQAAVFASDPAPGIRDKEVREARANESADEPDNAKYGGESIDLRPSVLTPSADPTENDGADGPKVISVEPQPPKRAASRTNLGKLALEGEELRRNLGSRMAAGSQRIALTRKIVLDFPHFQGFLTEYLANLSMTGMFVESKRPEPPGTLVAFEFRLADGLRLIQGAAEVVWRRKVSADADQPPGMGLRFVRLDKESRRLIRWAVEKQLREGRESFHLDGPVDADKSDRGTERSGIGPRERTSVRSLEETNRLTRYPYAGVAVARSRLRRWLVLACTSLFFTLLGILMVLHQPKKGEQELAKPVKPAVASVSRASGLPKSVKNEVEEPSVVAAVMAWAEAWSAQRVDDYLGFYSSAFSPQNGTSRDEWSALRKDRITRRQYVDIRIEELMVEPVGSDYTRVKFLQTYDSDSYRDKVFKTLELALEDGEWRILEERTARFIPDAVTNR